MLNITKTKIKKINQGDLLCYASICIDDSIVIDGIKLLNGKNGRYIRMAGRKIKNLNRERNYAYPINNDTRIQLLNEISEEYDNSSEE